MRRSPLKRSTTPIPRGNVQLKRTRPRRQGKVGKRKADFRAKTKAEYFKQYGRHGIAPCQWCKEDMIQGSCACHHKLKRSLGGKDTKKNALIVHPRCHEILIHMIPENLELALKSEANAENGRMVER